ncbi:methyltransferase domain-containing protein [Patescibacteria group bacterium]|nr:MAG: methyltransferase domain-containing protein [Patescibacteria group bacterium]
MPYLPSGTELLNPFQILERAGVKEGMRVADLGSGAIGHFVFPAGRMVGKNGAVYAVDILKSALAGVESRAKIEGAANVQTVWADIEVVGATNIPAGTLDIVLLINNLPKQSMVAEAVRLLKPGGKLLVVDWSPTASPFGPPSKDRVDKETAKRLAAEQKLRLKDEFQAGRYHYGLVFEK